MTVECITCDRLANDTTQAAQGLGRCSLRPGAGVSVSLNFRRDCAKHAPASEKTVTTRRAWLAKKGRA